MQQVGIHIFVRLQHATSGGGTKEQAVEHRTLRTSESRKSSQPKDSSVEEWETFPGQLRMDTLKAGRLLVCRQVRLCSVAACWGRGVLLNAGVQGFPHAQCCATLLHSRCFFHADNTACRLCRLTLTLLRWDAASLYFRLTASCDPFNASCPRHRVNSAPHQRHKSDGQGTTQVDA